jgi:hypothetical protein
MTVGHLKWRMKLVNVHETVSALGLDEPSLVNICPRRGAPHED